MAFSALARIVVRTGGSDENGGGFNTAAAGVDYSNQDAAQVTIDGVTISAAVHTNTSQINVTGYSVHANDVGNFLQINSGTATAGVYQITASDTGNNRWTVDRAAGTAAQTVVGKMGGAFASPGKAAKAFSDSGANGNILAIQAGTYTITTTTPGASGPVSLPNTRGRMRAFTTTPGDNTGYFTLSAGSQTSVVLFTFSSGTAATFSIWRAIADCNNQSGVSGFSLGTVRSACFYCKTINADQASAYGFGGTGNVFYCKAENCTTGYLGTSTEFCEAEGCATGFDDNGALGAVFNHSLAYDGSGVGFVFSSVASYATKCTSKGNGSYGFNVTSTIHNAVKLIDCVAVSNGAQGFRTASANSAAVLLNCAGYSNTGGDTTGTFYSNDGFITLTADPFVNAAADDYRPNSTAGGGAELRGEGSGLPDQTNNVDIGAVQHADPAGGGGITRRLAKLIGV